SSRLRVLNPDEGIAALPGESAVCAWMRFGPLPLHRRLRCLPCCASDVLDGHRLDDDRGVGPIARVPWSLGDFDGNVYALHYLTEERVMSIQRGVRRHGDEELAAVGVRSRIRHGEPSRPIVSQRRVDLVRELVARTSLSVAQ